MSTQVQKPPDILDDDNIQVNKPPDITDPEPIGDTYTGPDSFMEGVLNSGPEVLGAMGSGALGYLKGATVDIPSTLWGGLKQVGKALIDPTGTIMNLPQDLMDTANSVYETTQMAGSDPESFGRLMGQMTGQPAVTAGLVKTAPPVTRAMGTPVAATGRMIKNYQPLSGTLPRMFEPRITRIMESMLGRGIENIGNRMKGRPAPLEGEIMPDMAPSVMEGNFESIPNVSPVNTQRGLPPSNVSFYAPERNPVPPMELPPAPNQLQLPPSAAHYTGPSSVATPKQLPGYNNQLPPSRVTEYLGDGSPPFDINASGPKSVTAPVEPPKVRVNSEGNFVDLKNGTTFDQTGKVISQPAKLAEILQKPFTEMTFDELTLLSKQNLDRNVSSTVKRELAKRSEIPRTSPFFYKNRKY